MLLLSACSTRRMTPVFTTGALRERGVEPYELYSRIGDGRLARIRQGVLTDDLDLTPEACHRALVLGTEAYVHPGTVMSHWSAAVMHGLPAPRSQLERAWVTREGHTGGKIRNAVHMHHCPMLDWEVVEVDGVRCTSLARTAIDCARAGGFLAGVPVADAVLRLGTPRDEMWDVIRHGRRRPGNRSARRTTEFADPRSESPQESRARAIFEELGLERPVPQFEIRDSAGRFVARVDFAWPELRLVIEVDGFVKYAGLDGAELSSVLAREKAREQGIGLAGWWILRITPADLDHPKLLLAKIEQAMRVCRNMAA